METLGKHLLIEMWRCTRGTDDPAAVRAAIADAVETAGATLLRLEVHTYSPQGVTGVAVLAESHLSVHTWPEHGYVAADVYTCGTSTDPHAAARVLERHFAAGVVQVREVERGRRPEEPRVVEAA